MNGNVERAKKTVACIVPVLSVVIAALLLQFPLATMVPLSNHEVLYAWQSDLVRRFFPVFVLTVVAISVCLWILSGRVTRASQPGRAQHVANSLRPLAWLPLCVVLSQCSVWLGATVSGLIIAFGPALILALCAERLVGDSIRQDKSAGVRYWAVHFIVYSAFILGVGLYFNNEVGEQMGDEKHYMIIAQSLFEDGDMDLAREMKDFIPSAHPDRRQMLNYSHLRENKTGQLYSYHAFGLPILALPFWFTGFFGRQLVLALIAGFTIVGCGAACHAAGASRRASAIVAWGLGLTFAGAVNAIRFLPETLGCGLVVWAFWSILAQKKRPWVSSIVAAVCCGYLPYAHTRFAPVSLMLALFFGLEGLFGMRLEKMRVKVARLTVFSLIYAICGFTLLWFHSWMFSGSGAYEYDKILFSYPKAMWAVIVEHRGLFSVITPLVWYLAAAPHVIITERQYRRHGLEALAVVGVVLATSCSNSAALGGRCIPGRYFLTAVPLLLPSAALALSKCRSSARFWYYSLSAVSTLILFAALVLVKRGNFFSVLPLDSLRGYVGFHLIWQPLSSTLHSVSPEAFTYTTAYVLFLIAVSFLLMIIHLNGAILAVSTIMLLGAALVSGAKVNATENVERDRILGRMTVYWGSLQKVGDSGGTIFETLGIVEKLGNRNPFYLLSRDVEGLGPGGRIKVADIPPNDWDGRGYSWKGLHTQIRHNVDSTIAIRVIGQTLSGSAVFAVRQGALTLEDGVRCEPGKIDFTWIVTTRRGRGWVNPVVRIEGEHAAVRIDHVYVVPYSDPMGKGGLPLDHASTIRDLR